MKKLSKEDRFNKSLLALLAGATIKELAEINGSEASAYRQLNRLEGNYGCEISNVDTVYKLEDVGNGNIWRIVFDSLK